MICSAPVGASQSKGVAMIRGVKGSKIINKTFKFDGDKLKNKLEYQGNGKTPDRRYDENCEGLSLFIWPSGTKVFYAFKRVEMYNHKKGKLETNCLYKKMFRYQDAQGYKYRDAKDKLKAALDQLKNPVRVKTKKTLKELAAEFLSCLGSISFAEIFFRFLITFFLILNLLSKSQSSACTK